MIPWIIGSIVLYLIAMIANYEYFKNDKEDKK